MDRMSMSRRHFMSGVAGFGLVGCEAITPLPPQDYVVRPGELMFQVIRAESLEQSWGVRQSYDRTRATAITSYVLSGRLGDTLQVKRETVELRPQTRATSVYVTVPQSFPNQFHSEPGTTKRFAPEAYSIETMLHRRRELPGKLWSQSTQALLVPLSLETTSAVIWENHKLQITKVDPLGIHYRIEPPRV